MTVYFPPSWCYVRNVEPWMKERGLSRRIVLESISWDAETLTWSISFTLQ